MDLAWCPVCDKQTFAIENLYCSEACRKKDASSILNENCGYEFPRCSSRKPYQSPYNSPYNSPCNSPESSPATSPKLYPTNMSTTMMDYSSYIMSSSPSDLLLCGMPSSSPSSPFLSMTNRTIFFNKVNLSIMKARKKSSKNIPN